MPTLVMISKKAHEGPSPRETWVRRVFVIGYVALTIAMFANPRFELAGTTFTVPRLFWTVGLPLLPIGIVIAGFYPWRKVCPLAFWGEQGRRLDRLVKARSDGKTDDAEGKGKGAKAKPAKPGPQRRMPKWAEAWYPMIALGVLWLALAGRLVLTNGDGIALGILLVALGLTAALVNWRYTGKTWCNFICPVSIVERIYTEPNSLRLEHNSQCTTCTACKKNCPDIDQENSYWKDVEEKAKRMAYYSFPGLVLGFYTYFWLRAGDWEAYFGGGWTNQPITRELLTGPGLFFAPWLPAWAAAPLSLAAFMLASFAIFVGIERVLAKVWADEELRRHRVFTLAAFTAFNLFYLFAGAPTLRKLEYGPRVLAFAVPLIATMFLVKRWKRSRKDFVEERTAKQLLKKWKFKDAPPDDPAGVFAYLKAKESSEEQQLAVYRESVREAHADGVVTKAELQLLELLRSQLGISDGQHRKIVEELQTDTTQVLSVERELQLEGYRRALTEAMLGNAGEHEFRRLRREYNIDKPTHEKIATELRGEHSPMLERVREGLARITELRRDYLIPLAPLRASGTFELALFVLERMQQRALERVLEALPLTVGKGSDAELVRAAAAALSQPDVERREQALRDLSGKIADDFHRTLTEVVREPKPASSATPDEQAFHAAIERMLAHGDPHLRAGAIQAIGHLQLQAFAGKLAGLLGDEEPLVRETAIYASLRAPTLLQPAQLEALLRDEEPQIRRAAREAIEALADPGSIAQANPVRVVEGRTLPPIPDDAFSALATADKLLFLRCVPLFHELDPEDLHEICDIARERTVAMQGTICEQGDVSDDLYVLISGTASVMLAQRDSEVATLGPGDVVGELAAIDQSPRSATVRPKAGPVRMLEIRGNDFRKRVVQRKDVAPKLMATLSRRLRETLAKVR
jgi:hypothetical protein